MPCAQPHPPEHTTVLDLTSLGWPSQLWHVSTVSYESPRNEHVDSGGRQLATLCSHRTEQLKALQQFPQPMQANSSFRSHTAYGRQLSGMVTTRLRSSPGVWVAERTADADVV